jgi:hypothetical protein
MKIIVALCLFSSITYAQSSDLGQFLDKVVSSINDEPVPQSQNWGNPDGLSLNITPYIPQPKTSLVKACNSLFTQNATGQVQFYQLVGNRLLQKNIALPRLDLAQTQVADLNQDGTDEIIQAADQQLLIYAWQAQQWRLRETLATPVAFQRFWLADFNGDNRVDVMLQQSNGDVHFALLQQQPMQYAGKVAEQWVFQQYFVGDWDGDGLADFMVSDAQNQLWVYPFRAGKFHSAYQVASGLIGDYWADDWHKDGMMDLLVRQADGTVNLYDLRRDGLKHQGKVAENWHDAHYLSGDWNADGFSDILAIDAQNQAFLRVLAQNQFQPPQPVGELSTALLYLPLHLAQ